MVLVSLVLTACAARQTEVQDANVGLAFPEVRQIRFTGNHTFGARALHGAMASKQRPLFPPWKRGEAFHRPTLDADLLRLKKYYFDRGFLQAEAEAPDNQIERDAERNQVRISITIQEGKPTIVQSIQLAGIPDGLRSEAKMLPELPLRPGKRITKADFDSSKSQLLQVMQNQGYARARVIPRTAVDMTAHQAEVTFTLEPGDKTPLGQITISGHKLVHEQAIRRQLEIQTGDLYNPKKIEDSRDNVYSMRMFRAVTPRPANLDAEGNPPLDLGIEVRERKPHTFLFGPGASSIQRFRLLISWTHRNIFGKAESLTLTGKFGSFEQEAEAELHFPFFLIRRTSFTQTLFVRNEEEINTDPLGLFDAFNIEDPQPEFDLFTVGGVSRVTHRFTDKLSLAVGGELSYNDFSNVSDASEEDTEDNLLFLQFAVLRFDASNSLLNPTRGFVLQGQFSHSTTALLSDNNFVKLEFEGRHYLPIWWRMIFATRLALGSLQPYGGTDEAPQNVRFFAGGPGSVRGFVINRLGPLDANGDPRGGNSLIEGSFELRFPISGNLWGALFLDYGNVFRDSFTYRLADLRYAVGPGIRYLTPVGPIRFDIGFIIAPRSGENLGRPDFSFGPAF
ncbi:MAG: outer membrane protein assembly factor BamA [Candidatus Tectomicrobia bacterium]|nr:outer membrane protein assembly factor BamA [Candidatus Tectomicrobia bacterium]